MALTLHSLKPAKGAKKARKRVGRGNASGTGTYAGRGMKGQRSRSGVSGLKRRGLKENLMNFPKYRGTKSRQDAAQAVNVGDISKAFENGDEVTKKSLKEKNLISSVNKPVKILGNGELDKKLEFKKFAFSKTAKEKVEKSGSTIVVES